MLDVWQVVTMRLEEETVMLEEETGHNEVRGRESSSYLCNEHYKSSTDAVSAIAVWRKSQIIHA